ncbi:MAG: SDR family NAD(P)-dependent oxidoreductase, partial [Desulfobacterales bacterium]|nr:SDR family NAD(P)-dependent oxidoreductase [Desulfobacterales bacterium]
LIKTDEIEQLKNIQNDCLIWFLGGIQKEKNYYDLEALETSQQKGVMSLFRLIKILELIQVNIEIKVVTNNVYKVLSSDEIYPFPGSLHGLAKVIAKEYPKISVSCIDISLNDIEKLTRENLEAKGDFALRNGRRYEQIIEYIRLSPSLEIPFKNGGVYLILGGAGGIGFELTKFLIKTANAKIVIIGRKDLSFDNPNILYLKADASNEKDMASAVSKAKSHFGKINGVIHSAIVLKDRSITNMDEETFMEVMLPKVWGSVILSKVLSDEPMDFIIFFSSAQSFFPTSGQSNYAAASTFQDAFSLYLNQIKPYPVKLINWGYWGKVGIVSSPEYNKQITSKGVIPIEIEEGMEAVKRIASSGLSQIIPFKAKQELLNEIINGDFCVELLPCQIPSVLNDNDFKPDVFFNIEDNLHAFDELNNFARLLLYDTFKKMGGFKEKFIPKYNRLYKSLLPVKPFDSIDILEKKKSLLKEFKELSPYINLIWTCYLSYPEIFKGEKQAKDVIFPNSSADLVEEVYKGNPISDYFNKLVSESVKAYIFLRNNEKIKILEIGAGSGGTTEDVLKTISVFDNIYYLYTDISESLVEYGKTKYGHYKFVKFSTLNIEDEPYLTGYFDLIIAANVLHATKNIRNTISNTKKLLKKNGILILNEATSVSEFSTLTFGLLEGWWLFEDEDLRIKNSPIINSSMWKTLLEEEGFNNVLILPDNKSSQNVIISESNGEIRQKIHKKIKQQYVKDINIEEKVMERVAYVLQVDKKAINKDVSFSEYGVDSIIGVRLINDLNNTFNINLKTTAIFDYGNVIELSRYIHDHGKTHVKLEVPKTNKFHTHKGVVLSKPHNIDYIELYPLIPIEPKDNEVQILVKAFSINFGDLLCVKALYPTMPEYPFTPGFEVSGIILKTGSNVKKFKTGDEVIALTGSKMGGHSTIVNTDEILAVKKPKNVTYEEGCAFPVVFLTMYHVFETANIKKGDKILVQTAAGGTGLIAVQLAKLKGAIVYATAGSFEKISYLKEIGVSNVINYIEEDFSQKILKLTDGYGVDVVINTLPGDAIQKAIDILAPFGRYVEIAMTGLKNSGSLDLSKMTYNQVFYSIDLRRLLTKHPDVAVKYLEVMSKYLEKEIVKPTVSKVFSFSEIKEAYKFLEDRKNIGKVVVTTGNIEVLPEKSQTQDIAIIGMSGRFPGADNIYEFWEKLANSQSLITSIPKDRWDYEKYYDPDYKKLDKTNSMWGGFLSDIDKFDPLFFNISGKEAELSDPQQRIFLEESFRAMQDAGYSVKNISSKKCGVFVGVGAGDYQGRMEQANVPMEAQSFWGNAASILASRISYFLNLKGPSLAIDTACSSSLVAVHLACQSIISKESEIAIAGGVFICTTPKFYILSSNAGMLSPDGVCRAFDNDANGFVPGEGVGAVVLKPLESAIRDRDHIYGIIKGSGINQDGRTNGITAPSSISQTELELSVYEKYKINPETITYVEAHGTGTKLGDPIEIEALTNSFRKYTDKKKYCAIGSIKTNMGHAATAAGIASLIKVLLSLKYKQIPASLNFNKENEHTNFKDSPFYVNTKLLDWETPDNIPKRAAVSSFGFSGTNSHIVLEEYTMDYSFHRNDVIPARAGIQDTEKLLGSYLIVLSAKDKNRLKDYAKNILIFLKKNQMPLKDVAYTLQIDRSPMEERLSTVVSDTDILIEKLTKYCDDRKDIESFYTGNIDSDRLKSGLILEGIEGKEFLNSIIANSKLDKIAQLWVYGIDIDWKLLYHDHTPSRVPLPTYPFAKERYWIKEGIILHSSDIHSPNLHPMIGKNISTLKEQKFTTRLSGYEFYLNDHVVMGKKVLPGVAYLEMARASGEISAEKSVLKIKNMIWTKAIEFSDNAKPFDIYIKLYPEREQIRFELYSLNEDGQKNSHAQAKIVFDSKREDENIDIILIRDKLKNTIKKEEFYCKAKELGLYLGDSFQVVKELLFDENEVLSFIELPLKLKDTLKDFVLHPSLMDGALQTIMGGKKTGDNLHVPFSVEEIEIIKPLTQRCWVYTKVSEKNNIFILDESGRVLIKINGFVFREFKPNKIIYYENVLEKSDLKDSMVYGNEEGKIQKDIAEIASEILKIDVEKINPNENLTKYGFDSLAFTDLTITINEKYKLELTPAIFFEHPTLVSISNFLYKSYNQIFFSQRESPVFKTPRNESHNAIAIIGISCVMPNSRDKEAFWNHLVNGDDLITVVPKERWNLEEFPDCKWGGFIPDVDKFDNRFFGISPGEAELMDPQQRLFLETVWKTIEDAGYKASDLSGTNTGLFVGVATDDYHELLNKYVQEIEPHSSTGISRSVLANRISYFLNLHGPSEPIDTACSSSLVAIHKAVMAIQCGDCDMAIAGGVNVILTPSVTIAFSKAGMLSSDGKCKTFDKDADGYVRGEGVGAVLLKPLHMAEADCDYIYGVILGTAENHGGHAASLTAPNPKAQAQVLISAYERANISPSSISFIETHGTGTSLGDPVEINGLKIAFSDSKNLCGLGAVKTNIGHLETASGIAGIIKVLLSMKYKKLPKNLNFKELNPYINLDNSPFYIVKETCNWEHLKDVEGKTIPRRAGVSSFGFGGVNAHVVLEEYNIPISNYLASSHLIILSAKNEERLKNYAKEMIEFIRKDIKIENIAYTLQVGREEMEYRLAAVASDIDDLKNKLTCYVNDGDKIEKFYKGKAVSSKEVKINYIKDLDKVARLWVEGAKINWQIFYTDEKPMRIPLPTYPFLKERHWLKEIQTTSKNYNSNIHPFIDSNISTFDEQKFIKTLNGNDLFFNDYILSNKKGLPAVFALEMAAFTAKLSSKKEVKKITDIVWGLPLKILDKACEINISLYPVDENTDFEIIANKKIYTQGKVVYDKGFENIDPIDISAIKNRCNNIKSSDSYYNLLKSKGLLYGQTFQTIESISTNGTEGLSHIRLPKILYKDFNEFTLHPSLIDGAFQTAIGLINTKEIYFPFKIKEITLNHPLPKQCYIYVISNGGSNNKIKTFDIKISDEAGQVVIQMKEVSIRAVN